jgi:hypothetical protein
MLHFPDAVRIKLLDTANELGVLGDMITIVAIIQAHGSLAIRGNREWRELCEGETVSDAMAQLALWKAARSMRSDAMRTDAGIDPGVYRTVQRIREHLVRRRSSSLGRYGNSHQTQA